MAGYNSNHSPFLHQKSHHQQQRNYKQTTSNNNNNSSSSSRQSYNNKPFPSSLNSNTLNSQGDAQGGGGGQDAPPHQKQHNQQQQNPRRTPGSTSVSSNRKVVVEAEDTDEDETSEDDDQEDEDDEDETDDDDFTELADGETSDVENICLACAGECHCGGAEGRSIYVSATTSATVPIPSTTPAIKNDGLKIRLSNPTSSSSSRLPPTPSSSRNPLPAPTSTSKSKSKTSISNKRGRPLKMSSAALSAPLKKTSSTSSQTSTFNPHIPTPSRMSLRQVLAASVKEAEAAAARRSSSPEDNVAASEWQKKRETLSEVSDLDLEEEEDIDIEREEEKVLREEWEKKKNSKTGAGERDSSGSETDIEEEELESDWDDEDEGRDAKRRKMMRLGSAGVLEDEDDLDESDAEAIPFEGGRGVVTWSDYDSVEETSDVDKPANSISIVPADADADADATLTLPTTSTILSHEANEFEEELEELLAFSEALAGPVRAEDYDRGDVWFEEISNEGDAEDESSESSDSDDEDDEGETVILLAADGSWEFRERRDGEEGFSDESVGSSEEQTCSDDEDEGDTTDSLDSDDHVGLVRFGIEVDTEDEDESEMDREGGLFMIEPGGGTASLADVQAPTSADLATLPSCFLFASAPQTFGDAGGKGKGKEANHEIEDIDEEGEDDHDGRRTSPAMGMFEKKRVLPGRGTKRHQADVCLVIDESDAVAPSPFSKRKGKKRGRQLLDGSPSSRRRSDSKISTTTSFSMTSGSGSGEAASPLLVDNTASFDFDLDDVLHPSVLSRSRSVSSDSDTTSRKPRPSTSDASAAVPGLSDLTRWTRIPIGAFRSSTMPSSPFFSISSTAISQSLHHQPSPNKQNRLLHPHQHNIPSPANSGYHILRTAGPSLSHTLSSPHTRVTTKREIERRMLTSPVFGPSGVGNHHMTTAERGEPVLSHKLKRKAKKGQSSTTRRITSPK